MSKTSFRLLLIFSLLMFTRLIAMIYFPLQDTTEARYGEMARIMAETGDWITPYFDYGVPFWGKPPLVFWLEAFSIKLFGLNDFAPRFPSWIITIATSGLIYHLLFRLKHSMETALWGVVIYSSTLLVFLLAGVVILDPVFTFTTTLASIAFVIVLREQDTKWAYLFFIAMALGLLSKGPLALVLVGGTIGLWLLISPKRWRVFKLYPWISGVTLMFMITLPWYIMAELKTPGFLNYFIVGEHYLRFIDSGWSGDLYGVAHKEPHGTIWLYWVEVSFPWGIIAIGLLSRLLYKARSIQPIVNLLKHEEYSFYLIWALFPMLFFTLSGNVLQTYVLPGLPALAVLLALYFHNHTFFRQERSQKVATYTILLLPLLLMIILVITTLDKNIVRTEKYLIENYHQQKTDHEPLFYYQKLPFSARYYSQGRLKAITNEALDAMLKNRAYKHLYIAVKYDRTKDFEKQYPNASKALYSSRLYSLYRVTSHD